MSQVPYRNPISPVVVNSTVSVNRQSTIGTNFSILSVGGYQEVYNISDLFYTIPTGTYGYINYSGNSIPINFLKGSGTTSSIDILTLNSDNISSGRRKLGMLVYVYETDQIYQFNINNYDSLWSAATATTGTVTINNFGTIVRGDTPQGLAFISGWTGNTIEGLSGTSRQDAVWKKYYRTQQFINNLSTGLFYFTGITITSLTTFSVSPVKGWIVDNEVDVMNPTITYVEYSGQTGLTTPYLSSSTITYVLLTSGGTIVMSSTVPTTQQQRQNIYLGKLGHANRTSLIQAFNEPDYIQSPLSQMRDMFFPIGLINTGVYPSTNGANLQFNTSSGNLYGLGINYIGNIYTPNELIVSGQSPVTFQYRTQTGGTTGNITLIDPTNYDNGGVITLVGGGTNRSTNQRIFLTQTGTIRVQYGQQIYSDLPSAIAAANTENFITFTNFRDNAILIGILSVRHTATDLSDTTQARFLLASKFGETIGSSGGISTTTLQQAYNNSSTPEIVTNSGLGALSIENGTGNPDSSTLLLEGQNSVGTTTSFLRADGMISGSTFSTQGFTANTNGLTATTVSATTYYNLPGSSSSNCFTTFYTTNISGCSPVNILSLLNVTDGLSVTGTSTFSGPVSLTSGFTANTITVTSSTVNGNLTVTGTTYSPIFTGNSLTLSNSASTIYLDNTTAQQIKFYDAGRGVPTYNSYSSGAKIIFSDNISSISSGFAIGVDTGTLWYGADLAGNGHEWYAGTRKLMSLSNASGFKLIGLGAVSDAALTISGSPIGFAKGGDGYTDFLRVINNATGATNTDKWFRMNVTGGIEILNSSYTSTIFSLGDNGVTQVAGGNNATTSSNDAQTNYLSFGNNSLQLYDDGNPHIHSRVNGSSLWINTNNAQLNLLTQSPTSTGSIGTGIAIATTTLNGYVTINTGRTVTTAAAYGYLTTGGAGTYPGGSQTISISLYANNRIWGQEIDAFSDERMKNIEGEISLEEGIKLVNNLKPIKYTWKEGDDKGLKAGYSAQQVIKSGFDHLISVIPTEGLKETVDEDGFTSPKDTQFSMNYDQVTPYHGVVIKHLLEEIENLKKQITREYLPVNPRTTPSSLIQSLLTATPEEIQQLKDLLGL